ncbi:hypothetical protein 2 [Beihai picorna-like virus 18]|uniref:hypothetical protein 2 n=1 Tax=Beihai picorna-like virus 18 TaxID=1922560 RepID=UPI00090A8C99|nr:hypothetical protein 2 [Beihai picorna-like virus 18]APG76870.1 hypothetical protein 2 [Beihai picorna-like virus 18]
MQVPEGTKFFFHTMILGVVLGFFRNVRERLQDESACVVEPQMATREKRRCPHVGSFRHKGECIHIVHMTEKEWFAYKRSLDKKRIDKASIVPQMDMMSNTVVEKSQTVKFLDQSPGFSAMETPAVDSVRDDIFSSDLPIEKFFERPIKIRTITWQRSATRLNEIFYPWELYFGNKHVVNRIANYNIASANLHLKFVINGTPFHYGRVMMSYRPLPAYDDLSRTRSFVEADMIGMSQRPHVYLDPATNTGGELVLPFFYFRDAVQVPAEDSEFSGTSPWRDLGLCNVVDLNPLYAVNDASPSPVNIEVYAWASDVRMAHPTHVLPWDIQPQMAMEDEYTGKGIVSGPATAVANVAKKLKNTPIIGTYARATEIAARATAGIASIFGYSRPAMLETARYRPDTKGSMAITNMEDDVAKLTVDGKQETTISQEAFGLQGADPLDIAMIAQRESWIVTFQWPTSLTSDDLLFNTVVDPMTCRVAVQSGVSGTTEYHLTPLAFCALPFKYWRGNLKYRFQVVCSKFHKGRLKVVWDPVANAGDTSPSDNVHTVAVVDISECTDFEVTIGMGQSTMFRKMGELDTLTNSVMYSNLPLFYYSDVQGYGNGVLSVYVVNDLVTPDPTITSNVAVNVFVRADENIEFAAPNGKYINKMKYRSVLEVQSEAEVFEQKEQKSLRESRLAKRHIHPQMDTIPTDTQASKPQEVPNVADMGDQVSITDPANLVYFGESVRSFRALLKRYCFHENIPIVGVPKNGIPWNVDNVSQSVFKRTAFPIDGGYTTKNGTIDRNVVYDLSGNSYVYAGTTLLQYIAHAFAGARGGVRYLIDAGNLQCDCSVIGSLQVTRAPGCIPENSYDDFDFVNQNNAVVQAKSLDIAQSFSGLDGIYVQNLHVNPTVCVEIPWYSNYRFFPSRRLTNYGGSNPVDDIQSSLPSFDIGLQTKFTDNLTTKRLTTYVAAAEDFNVSFFRGCARDVL